MPKELTKEQYWKLFNNLSEEMKNVILSEETATDIFNICEKNKIDDVSKVADYIGQTLLGILPPDKLQGILDKELNLGKSRSQAVMQEINRFIFYPIKGLLEELYETELLQKKPSGISAPETKPTPTGPDTYREAIE